MICSWGLQLAQAYLEEQVVKLVQVDGVVNPIPP
ncbi:hypothetical protein XM38_042920 [Halomicronema hongdechloris C2206]|uniref:Uncharacterized protein n=1 Tax=Halomicronema hongdechloris C2206 TaxID=1641165 RepID=A0A1Z3HSP9_9CYAN|nr:hypothetical protein XM38_042920 [Halomicronema hongdechloris C2206]